MLWKRLSSKSWERTLLSGAGAISVFWTPNRLGVYLSFAFGNIHKYLAQVRHIGTNKFWPFKAPSLFHQKGVLKSTFAPLQKNNDLCFCSAPSGVDVLPTFCLKLLQLQCPYLSPYYGNARHCILNCKLCWGFGNVKVYEGKFIYLTKVHVACDLTMALSRQLTKKIYLSSADR